MSEIATLGGGCFWCLEAAYNQLQGVEECLSGYCGGTVPQPTYQQVCTGTTGHAEVIQVRFDPAQISYWTLLEIFFALHDPTTLNRQGADVGTQYRSVIFTHSPSQASEAAAVREELNQQGLWSKPIVTEILPAPTFYPAEAYHQGYYVQNPEQAYCQAVVGPKLVKFRQKFLNLLRKPSSAGN